MCGIAALIAPRPTLAPKLIREMTQRVRHRGPDDEGFLYAGMAGGNDALALAGADTPAEVLHGAHPWCPRQAVEAAAVPPAAIQLGHRRLSIIDTSPGGHQPMCTPDRTTWIVFNGEIYNYVELREELKRQGGIFRTDSDTEVLLACYRKWGAECLQRLHGMFAFVLYDGVKRRVFAARDRFGIKPLYYWIGPAGQVAFASEIKQFGGLPGWSARVNGQRAYEFLSWAILDHSDETLFEGVRQVRNGELIELELDRMPSVEPGGGLPARRWYTLPRAAFLGSEQEAVERFRDLFQDAVRTHLRADVPVGSCLSGGLDSSSVVCVMNKLLRQADARAPQRTFSACAREARYDERQYIDEVVRHTDVAADYVYPCVEDLFSYLDHLTWHQDEPFGSTSVFAQWEVFGLAARNGVKVMLDGQGADEQLAGYDVFTAARFNGLLRSFRLGVLWSEIKATRRLQGHSEWWAARHLLDGMLPSGARFLARRWAGKASARPAWLDLEALKARPADPHREDGKAPSVRQLSVRQLMRSNLQMLLHWEDRNSMAHSIEARVPFLDHRLVEFVVSLPEEMKLSGGWTKRILREAMKGLLPEPVRLRTDKLGFVTPEEIWVHDQAPTQFRSAVQEAIDVARPVLTPTAGQLAERIINREVPFTFALWRMISFGRWMARHRVALR